MAVNPFAALIHKVNDLETQIASLGGSTASVGTSRIVQGVMNSSQDALTIELLEDTGQTQGVFGADGLNLEIHYSGLLSADGESFESFSARLFLTVALNGAEGGIAAPLWTAFLDMKTQLRVDATRLTGEKQMAWASMLHQVTMHQNKDLYGDVAWMGADNINRTPDRYGAAGSTAIPILEGVYDSDGAMSPGQMYIVLGNGMTPYVWKNIYTSIGLSTSQWQAQWQVSGGPLPSAEPAAAPAPSPSGLTAALRGLPVVKHFLRGRGS